MKVINRDELAEENELGKVASLEHENVVKFVDHFEIDYDYKIDSNKNQLAIITEYCQVYLKFSFFLNYFIIYNDFC